MCPILLHFKFFTVYSYGVFAALAVLAAFFAAMKLAEVKGLPENDAANFVFLFFILGIVGARVFYVLQHFEDYRQSLWQAFYIQEGGLVWYGGFLAASLGGFIYALARRMPLLKWCDFFSPILALGHGIGRVGCFFNGCCYGRVTSSRFGVVFPDEAFAKWPIQLYEAVFLFLLSFFLFRCYLKSHREGAIFILYLVAYSAGRFFLEFLRGDQAHIAFLTLPQWTSLFLFFGGVILFFGSKISWHK